MHQSISNKKKAALKPDGTKMSLTEHYLDQLQHVPGVRKLIGEKGSFIPGSTKSTSDFSYSALKYSGDHFRIIGDAASALIRFTFFYLTHCDDQTSWTRSFLLVSTSP